MLKNRVITSIYLSLLGIFLLFLSGPFFPFLLWLLFALMVLEWVSMRKQILGDEGELLRVNPYQYDNTVRVCCVIALVSFSSLFYLVPFFSIKVGGIFWLLALASLFCSSKSMQFLVGFWPYMFTGLIMFIAAWTAAVYLHTLSPWLLLDVILVIAASDSGAYFAGKKWGKSLLAKDISPHKTREGAWGGLAAGILVSLFFWIFSHLFPGLLRLSFLRAISSGFFIVVFGIVGDLFESRIKRLLNVKDSGKFLPGHGGLLDRFDSHLAGLVVAALILA